MEEINKNNNKVNKIIKHSMNFISSMVTVILFAIVVILAFFFITNRGENGTPIAGYRLLTVLTDSMNPVMPAGDLIIIRTVDRESIFAGDIVAYKPSETDNVLVTHRVVGITEDLRYITKGDAVAVIDKEPVKYENIVGKYMFSVPFIGIIVSYIKSPFSIALVIIIFVLLVLLFDVIKKLLKK